ncbi:LLM class flavin-dependent oxidoreductase [Shouchella shacheensis]|uniref:LLM class flavin-dependent oxidoreductase n=1 Tax=Shouchella shacheensis TaxID=1649580 RepID=UPI00073FE513|nr:LLM class flavin-dependent oxidoreductase [Shouchella shacheensis]
MRLSILDQIPRSTHTTNEVALSESGELAQAAESFGYHRYWIAEHHDLSGLLCPAPEVLLAYIGAKTHSIRLGAGAILLPHYAPYKVAETFNMLANLFPNRIDLGLGRSPGGSAEASIALSGNFVERVHTMGARVEELMHFFRQDFPEGHTYSGLQASPVPFQSPSVWMLGTSKKSATLAAKTATNYAYGHFMKAENGPDVVARYREQRESAPRDTMVAVSALCADTRDRAHALYRSVQVWQACVNKGKQLQSIPTEQEAEDYLMALPETERETILEEKSAAIVGDQDDVKTELERIALLYEADELMILTHAPTFQDRLHSYRLIAEAIPQLTSF